MRRWVEKLLGKERAQSMVEMAVLTPLLLFVVLGVVDLGRVFYAYVTITNAAREGARVGSTFPTDTNRIEARVVAESGGTLDLGAGNNRISTLIGYSSGADNIEVRVNYSFQTFFLGPVSQMVSGALGGPTIPADFPISTSATMPIMIGNPPLPPTSTPTLTATSTNTPTSAYVTLNPGSGFGGMVITILGGNFGANTTIVLTWDGNPLASGPSPLICDGGGAFSGTFVVPGGASIGNHTVVASVGGGATANSPFDVIPIPTATATAPATATATSTATSTPSATPTCVPVVFNQMVAGDTWVSGSGPANLTVEVDIQDHGNVYSGLISAGGTFSITTDALVQGKIVIGQVVGCSPSSSLVNPAPTPTATRTPTRTATPTYAYILLSPATGSPGNRINVIGYNFGNNKSITLQWDGSNISTVPASPRTDSSGYFSIGFDVPGGAALGSHTVGASTSSGSATKTFEVIVPPTATSTPTASTTATATQTRTATATSTSTPTTAYFTLVECVSSTGWQDLTLYGHNWPASGNKIEVYFDGVRQDRFNTVATWTSTINVNVTAGSHTVRVIETESQTTYQRSLTEPCPTSTPTATATATATPFADLIVSDISAAPSQVPANQPITVMVTIRNQGTGSATSLFWVDLYQDPIDPPGILETGFVWQAISSLAAGDEIQLSFQLGGFGTLGTHPIMAQVDTMGQITESSESNNVSSAVNVEVGTGSPTATPAQTATATITSTPTETATPGNAATATAQSWTPIATSTGTATATATATPVAGSVSGSTAKLVAGLAPTH